MFISQNVGTDISKDDFEVCFRTMEENRVLKIRGTRKFKNNKKGFEFFINWIEKKRLKDLELKITMEATGVYHEGLAYYLNEKGYQVCIVLGNKSKSFAKSLNQKSKTDKIDAKVLSQMGLERNLKEWKPLSKGMRKLKKLSRHRVRLLDQKVVVNNQLHAERHSHSPEKGIMKSQRLLLKHISAEIKKVEKQIKEIIENDEVLSLHCKNICKIKGVGLITFATIIAETDGFSNFTSRSQLVSFVGYDVVYNQSGLQKGKTRISKRGNKYIRRALHFPALTAVKYEEKYKKLYKRIYEKGSEKMVGYVAVQRKLLTTIYALFKNNSAYEHNYNPDQKAKYKEDNLRIIMA